MDDQIEVAFEADPADFLAYAAHIATSGELFRSQMQRSRVLVTLLWPLVGGLGILMANDRFFTVAMLLVVLIAAPVTWLIWPARWRQALKRQSERQVTMEDPFILTGPRRFIISPESVQFTTAYSGGYVRWSAIRRVSSDDRSAYLHLSQAQAYIIPRRAFADSEDFDRFLAAAQAFASAARGA